MSYVQQNLIIGNRLDAKTGAHIVTTTKGQLISDNGTQTTTQPSPTLNNQVLVADSTQATGLIWRVLTAADLALIAGAGLTLTGNQLDVGGSSTIFANADNLIVNSSAILNQVLLSAGTVGTSAVYGALPLSNAASVTGILPFANGGTGSSAYTSGNSIIATNAGNTALVDTGLNPVDITFIKASITTTDATQTTILTIPTVSDKAYVIKATFLARQTTTPFATASFNLSATVNNVAGTVTLVGGANDLQYVPVTTVWTAAINVSGTNIILQVVGQAATTVNWNVKVDPIQSI